MNKNRYLTLHALRVFAAHNGNRDELGQPKQMMFGDAVRTTMSTQAQKRIVRVHHLGDNIGTRTRRFALKLFAAMQQANPAAPLYYLLLMARAIISAYATPGNAESDDKGKNVEKKKLLKEITDLVTACASEAKPKDKDQEKLRDLYDSDKGMDAVDAYLSTGETYFFSPPEMETALELARTLAAEKNPQNFIKDHLQAEKGKVKSEFKPAFLKDKNLILTEAQAGSEGTTPDIMATGRFSAKHPEATISGAISMAWTFTVHPGVIEHDYFTAVDDLPSRDGNGGAAHQGDAWFTSGLSYLCMIIDLEQLLKLAGGNRKVAVKALRLWAEGFLTFTPQGRKRAMHGNTGMEYALAVRSNFEPTSLASAFFQSLDTQGATEDGIILEAISKIEDRHAAMLETHGTRYCPVGDSRINLRAKAGERGSLDALLAYAAADLE
mgnify:CR=1 FL=1